MKPGALRLGAAGWVRSRVLVLAAGAVALAAAAAVMTDGRFDLLTRGEHFSDFYDQLGRSILHGRFDVPPQTIGPEAFLIGGRTYGYFGPTPALLRIPLDFLFPSMWGRWTRLVMLAASAVSLVAAQAVHRRVRQALSAPPRGPVATQAVDGAFVLVAGLGTTLLFIARRPILYHEAIAVAAALALGAFATLVRYLAERNVRHLVFSVMLAVLAVLARASVGTGALLALVLLAGGMVLRALGRRDPEANTAGPPRALDRALGFFAVPRGDAVRKQALLLLGLLALGGAAIAFRNLRTVGNLSGEPPLDKHVAIMKDPARLARTQGRFVHPENLRTLLYNYLRPDGVAVRGSFPRFFPRPGPTARQFAEAHLDNAEPYVSLTSVYPVWLGLSLAGLVVAFGPWGRSPEDHRPELRLALLGAAIGCAGPFIAVYLTLRYLHDLFPFLVVAGATGLEGLLALATRRTWARIALVAAALLGLYTILASVGVTLATGRWT